MCIESPYHTIWTCVTGVRRLKLRDSDLQRTTRNTMLPILSTMKARSAETNGIVQCAGTLYITTSVTCIHLKLARLQCSEEFSGVFRPSERAG